MSEDISKLPKWAQRRIATLEANAEYYQQQTREAVGISPESSPIEIERWRKHAGGAPAYLPVGTIVSYTIGDASLDVRMTEWGLNISSTTSALLVRPGTSNSVTLVPIHSARQERDVVALASRQNPV